MTPTDRDRIADAAEARLGPLALAALQAQGDAAAAAMEAGGNVLGAIEDAAPAVLAAYRDALPRAYAEAAALAYADVDSQKRLPGVDDFLAAALAWLDREGAELVRWVTDTTKDLIRAIVTEGFTDGLNPRAVARLIRDEWPDVSRYRAEVIARTEALRAANTGQGAGYDRARDDLGLELEKVWVATIGDGRTRETHVAANGQRVPYDEPFSVGGFQTPHPLGEGLPASESIQCRCTWSVVVVGRKSVSPMDARNAWIREVYAERVEAKGLPVALDEMEREIAERAGADGWPPIGGRQIRKVAKGRA